MDPSANSPDPHEAPVTPQVVGPPSQPPAPPRRRRGPTRLLIAMLILGFVVVLLLCVGVVSLPTGGLGGGASARLQERHHSLARLARDKVAIISLEGMITDGEGFIKRQIEQARRDNRVKAVVLRVNSPGGTINGSDYIYYQLRKLVEEREIPIVVSMGMVAASGGYYVAMAVGDTPDSIYAEPTTFTGSIGVIIPRYDFSGLMEEWKISEDSIMSHPLKGAGSFTKPMTPEERKIFEAIVEDGFDRFKDIVKSGRPQFREHPEQLDEAATGQIFTTRQALANGLVDKEGFLDDAIERALELAGLDKEKAQAVEYRQPFTLFGGLLGESVRGSAELDLSIFSDLATPKAYYLYTWLPGIDLSKLSFSPRYTLLRAP